MDASGTSITARFFCLPFDIRQPSPAKIIIFNFTRSKSTVAPLIYLNVAPQSAGFADPDHYLARDPHAGVQPNYK